MTEPVSSSSSSSQHQSKTQTQTQSHNSGSMTIDIRPMIEDVSQVMTKHITNILSGVIGEYTVYKETHDTIMGLPCVRKLQERIHELEGSNSNERSTGGGQSRKTAETTNECGGGGLSREDEILQLQSAIAELNRYIVALESKVDMKNVCPSSGSSQPSVFGTTTASDTNYQEEESIRLEIHENDTSNSAKTNEHEEKPIFSCSNTKNEIVSSSLSSGECESEAQNTDDDDKATESTEELASLAQEVQQQIAEEDAVEDDAEDAGEDAGEDAEEAGEEDAEDAAEEDAAEEEETVAEEDAEIEVSEIKIKGKTYFTTDPQNGIIYACVDDDVGDEVGVFKNGVAVFNKGKK